MNTIARLFLSTALLVGGAFAIYRVALTDHRLELQAQINALEQEMAERVAQRDAMIERLSRSHRLAHITITGQRTAEPGGEIIETELEFIELADDGSQLGRQSFTVPGDVLFVDAWTARFDAASVAEGHPLRGRTLVLLRRVYSDRLPPREGIEIDTPGAIPAGYAVSDVARFERAIWEQFWTLATSPEAAAKAGVLVAQGEAVYKPVRTGQVYELQVNALGGMSLLPLPTVADASWQGKGESG